MATYNSVTDRDDVQALIPEEVSNEMLGKATQASAVLTTFRRIPVNTNQTRFPILSTLPVAYWVSGDTGLKQTTDMSWTNKYINIEEVAAIFPVPENVVDDMRFNIWNEAMPLLAEAVGRVVDSAVFFGTNAPASFPDDIVTAATAAGNNVAENGTAATGGFFGDVDDLYEEVESDGYRVSAFIGEVGIRSKLRRSRDTTGQKTDVGRTNGALDSIDGLPFYALMDGLWPTTTGTAELFAGAWNEFVVGVRKDITWKLLTEAVIQDNTGAIVWNLAQQDMVALRLTFRMGWQVANRINNQEPDEADRYPAGFMTRP